MQQSYVEILWSSTLPRINFLLPWRVWPSRSSRLVKRHWAELFYDVQRSHLLLQVLYFWFFFHRLLCFFLNLRTPCVGPITIWDAPCLKEDQEHRGLEPWSMKWTMKSWNESWPEKSLWFLFHQGIAYSSRAEEQKFGCALTAVAMMRFPRRKKRTAGWVGNWSFDSWREGVHNQRHVGGPFGSLFAFWLFMFYLIRMG